MSHEIVRESLSLYGANSPYAASASEGTFVNCKSKNFSRRVTIGLLEVMSQRLYHTSQVIYNEAHLKVRQKYMQDL